MDSRRVIGVAASPNLAGVDAVLLETTGDAGQLRPSLIHWLHEPFSRELRELLVRVCSPEAADVRQIALADRLLGEWFAAAVRNLADQASVSLRSILCIGSGGLTAWHEVSPRFRTHLSLGAAAWIAERTGLSVADDFAARDQACGGQGAPLAACVDALLFGHPEERRLVLHLGGLTHVTVLSPGLPPVGWQAGPGTVVLDALTQCLTQGKELRDNGGRHAVQGRHIPELLERWLLHPFLAGRPPRSVHRWAFAEQFARQTCAQAQQKSWERNDVLCTATHWIARALADSLRRFLPRGLAPTRAILTGAGVRNGFLWRLLQEQLPEMVLERSDDYGYPAESKEAMDAALLACLLLDGEPGNLPGVTGASGPRLLGRWTPGSLSNWSRCLAWMTGQRQADWDED
jgi:anhydro-N-acetylmuramic acid kinase